MDLNLSMTRKEWINLAIDVFMASIILWVWFFGIKIYCDPMVICPNETMYMINLSRDIGFGNPENISGIFNISDLFNSTP